ncbi:MAG TPA: DinB family protein [Tepidisphaeraceae bacterium]|jgi:uncharacterized damage-inducible protein DinB
MADEDAILTLVNYDLWCTDHLAANMESLSIEDVTREFPIGWRTLHRTLHHIVTTAELWSDRSLANPSGIRPEEKNSGPQLFSTTSLRERYRVAGRQMLSSLAVLYATPGSAKDVGWHIRRNHLIHITTHSMHHRAQMIFMLTQLGVPDIIEGGDYGGWANGPLKTSVDRKTIAKFLY